MMNTLPHLNDKRYLQLLQIYSTAITNIKF